MSFLSLFLLHFLAKFCTHFSSIERSTIDMKLWHTCPVVSVHRHRIRLDLTLSYGLGDDDIVLVLWQPRLWMVFLHFVRSQVERDSWSIDIFMSSHSSQILSSCFFFGLPLHRLWPSKPCTPVVRHISLTSCIIMNLWGLCAHPVLISFRSQSQSIFSCFLIFRSQSLEFITCQHPWISLTSYF